MAKKICSQNNISTFPIVANSNLEDENLTLDNNLEGITSTRELKKRKLSELYKRYTCSNWMTLRRDLIYYLNNSSLQIKFHRCLSTFNDGKCGSVLNQEIMFILQQLHLYIQQDYLTRIIQFYTDLKIKQGKGVKCHKTTCATKYVRVFIKRFFFLKLTKSIQEL